ncbi:hypothetical protein LJC05_03195, partial [Bacteroides sp. OttesenSCG-928-J23]|nr:hypothetical protein [Bacteroides sp. OttesenSCG-928-J23]
ALIRCGALDRFGHNRRQMAEGFERLLENVEKQHHNNISGQMDLFGNAEASKNADYILPSVEEYPLMQLLGYEKETTGLYISGHPLEEHEAMAKKLRTTSITYLHREGAKDGTPVQVLGIISAKKLKTTRNNDMMAFVGIEDKTGSIECIVFPKTYTQYSHELVPGKVVYLRGRLKAGEEEEPQIIAELVSPPEQALDLPPREERPRYGGNSGYQNGGGQSAPAKQKSAKQGLYLKFPDKDCPQIQQASNVLFVFEGQLPVYFYYSDVGKYNLTPRSYWISPNDVMLGELKRLLGGENVALMD